MREKTRGSKRRRKTEKERHMYMCASVSGHIIGDPNESMTKRSDKNGV
jgi:hypothetical protein